MNKTNLVKALLILVLFVVGLSSLLYSMDRQQAFDNARDGYMSCQGILAFPYMVDDETGETFIYIVDKWEKVYLPDDSDCFIILD